MATTLENLEELTNDGLRVRLSEYGFPNMPVTNTTRKVLIKKLRTAIDQNQSKTRRETINVAKYSSAEESGESENEKKSSKKAEKTNRRATIAATSVAPKKDVRPVLAKPLPVARRTGRNTPSAVNQATLTLIENSDDEEIPKKVSPVKNGRSQTRSPSLGKSETVTTSYKQVIQSVAEETNADLDDEDEVILLDDNDDEDDSIANELSSFQLPTTFDRPAWTSTARQTTTKTTRTQIGDNDAAKTAALRRLTVGSGASTSFQPATSNISSLNSHYGTTTSSTSHISAGTSYKRRYTTNPSTITSTSRYNGSDENDDDDVLDGHNAPFLSDFTRRLAELKAIPLVKDLNPSSTATYKSTVVTSPTAYRTTGTEYYRTQTDRIGASSLAHRQKKTDTISGSFVNFVRVCENKIRRPFFIVFFVLLIVFIYVMFFHN